MYYYVTLSNANMAVVASRSYREDLNRLCAHDYATLDLPIRFSVPIDADTNSSGAFPAPASVGMLTLPLSSLICRFQSRLNDLEFAPDGKGLCKIVPI